MKIIYYVDLKTMQVLRDIILIRACVAKSKSMATNARIIGGIVMHPKRHTAKGRS